MISLVKWTILTPSQKLPNSVSDLGKIICATGFECLPKKQKIAQSDHTDANSNGWKGRRVYKNEVERSPKLRTKRLTKIVDTKTYALLWTFTT